MLICDAHSDTLHAIRNDDRAKTDITLERLEKGHVNLQTLAMFVGDSEKMEDIELAFTQMLKAFEHLKQNGYVQAFDPSETQEGKVKVMLSIEGCEIFKESVDEIDRFKEMGVRMAALVWNYKNALGMPAKFDDTTGLTPFGKQAVKRMMQLKVAPDVSHLNIKGFYDVLEQGAVPVASHSCCRKLCNHFRNLNDDQLKAIFSVGGFVGVNFYPSFLNETGVATLDNVVDHIVHMMDKGGTKGVGFGSDFDGIETKVQGLENPLGYENLINQMRKRRFTEEEIKDVCGNNFLNYFKRI